MLPKNVSVSDVLILNCARFQLYQLYLDLQLRSNTFVASASYNVGHENKALARKFFGEKLDFFLEYQTVDSMVRLVLDAKTRSMIKVICQGNCII